MPALALTASVLFVGKRPDIDYSVYPYPTVTLPGYVLLNAVISTPISSSFDLFVRLDNILNTRYETVWGYGTLSFAATVGFRLNR